MASILLNAVLTRTCSPSHARTPSTAPNVGTGACASPRQTRSRRRASEQKATRSPAAAGDPSHCAHDLLGRAGVKGPLRRPPAALDPSPSPQARDDPHKPEESRILGRFGTVTPETPHRHPAGDTPNAYTRRLRRVPDRAPNDHQRSRPSTSPVTSTPSATERSGLAPRTRRSPQPHRRPRRPRAGKTPLSRTTSRSTTGTEVGSPSTVARLGARPVGAGSCAC